MDNIEKSEDKDAEFKELMAFAGEIGANIPGALVATFVPGSMGIVAGVLIATSLKEVLIRTGVNVYRRIVESRGKIRAGFAAIYATAKVAERIEQGEAVRLDNFFSTDGKRSKADEILEGVMIKCRDVYEEKKAPLIANIFVTATFDESYSAEEVSYLIQLSEKLTFRQIVLLRIFADIGHASRQSVLLPERDFSRVKDASIISVLSEIRDLSGLNLLSFKSSLTFDQLGGIEASSINPARVRITDLGRRLTRVIQIADVSELDVARVRNLLTTEVEGISNDFKVENVTQANRVEI